MSWRRITLFCSALFDVAPSLRHSAFTHCVQSVMWIFISYNTGVLGVVVVQLQMLSMGPHIWWSYIGEVCRSCSPADVPKLSQGEKALLRTKLPYLLISSVISQPSVWWLLCSLWLKKYWSNIAVLILAFNVIAVCVCDCIPKHFSDLKGLQIFKLTMKIKYFLYQKLAFLRNCAGVSEWDIRNPCSLWFLSGLHPTPSARHPFPSLAACPHFSLSPYSGLMHPSQGRRET